MLIFSLRIAAILLALYSACGTGLAVAQPADGDCSAAQLEDSAAEHSHWLEAGMREDGLWFGVSLNSAKVGGAPGQIGKLFILGVRYGKIVASGRVAAVEYVADLIPLAIVTDIPTDRYEWGWADTTVAYAIGLSPLGLQLCFLPSGRTKLFAGATAGLMLFSRDVPVEGSRRINFRFEGGVGLRRAVAPGWSVGLGIAFHHVSSGSREAPNPGLDWWVLQVGLSRWRRS